jgi:hypothetical protein
MDKLKAIGRENLVLLEEELNERLTKARVGFESLSPEQFLEHKGKALCLKGLVKEVHHLCNPTEKKVKKKLDK